MISIVQRGNIKPLNNIFRVCIGFIVFIVRKKPLKVSMTTVLGHMVEVLLQYKVGATPELGPHFREVKAADTLLPIKGVLILIDNTGCYMYVK